MPTKKLTTGGAVLLKKYGSKHFSKISKKRWAKYRANKKITTL